jgi:hypothetical protein
MDINSLLGTMLGADSLAGISQATGASQQEVGSVLSAALPSLLNGLSQQADNEETAAGFDIALADHAKVDTSNVASFMNGVDLDDGAKILGHLFGGNTQAQTQQIAQQTGVSAAQSGSIMSAAAPLLMSLLGQQTANDNSGLATNLLLKMLLKNVDIGSLAGLLLGAASTNTAAPSQQTTIPLTPQAQQKPQGGGLLSILRKIFG